MFVFNSRLANGQLANHDPATGIFYGCIQTSGASLLSDWVVNEDLWSGGPDVTCEWADDQYEVDEDGNKTDQLQDDCGDPVSWSFHDEKAGVAGVPLMDDTCFLVTLSPFYTFARQCSPCVPNAGDLDNAGEGETVKCYCPPADWYEEGKAPPMWRVADDTRV